MVASPYLLQIFRSKNETHIAQAKILIVLVYYIVVGASVLTAYSVFTRNETVFKDELREYFICEAAGTGEPCDRSGFMDSNHPVLEAISYILLGLTPVTNLVYVMNFQKMKETCRRWYRCGLEKILSRIAHRST